MKARLVLLLLLGIALNGPAQPRAIITYVGGYRGNVIDTKKIEVNGLTHLLYAFANVRHNRAVLDYPKTDALNLKSLAALKKINPRLKVLLSVGGLGWSRNFSDMALSEENRQIFGQSCLALVKRFSLDGIDIDWEFPGYPGEGGNVYRPGDKQNYTLLFKTLRETLGHNYLITTAVDGWATHFVPHTQMDQVAKYADFILLMTYNFNVNGLAGGHYLYAPPGWDPNGSVDGAVQAFITAGVPKAKLVIGAGFFPAAVQMRSIDPKDRHMVKKLNFRGGLARVNAMMNREGFRRYWDTIGQAPYLFSPKTKLRIAYEDTASIAAKWRYVQQHDLAGLMYWDYFSDPGRKLLHRLTQPVSCVKCTRGYGGRSGTLIPVLSLLSTVRQATPASP